MTIEPETPRITISLGRAATVTSVIIGVIAILTAVLGVGSYIDQRPTEDEVRRMVDERISARINTLDYRMERVEEDVRVIRELVEGRSRRDGGP